ncbi:hypothetical protein [Kaistella polysaccharea]|uniref:hypothetical protein n=1 Tax=Kaistella polysaccharea TaxID=2878534 RepID=UPI001CF177E2|nr:hypothetical protein [Kaistella polysaccharea]
MTYTIAGIFETEHDAISASNQLESCGFIQEFLGYTQNANVRPEVLSEDHFVEKTKVDVYTPNINRAHQAKNILLKAGAIRLKAEGLKLRTIISTTTMLLLPYSAHPKTNKKSRFTNIRTTG